MRKVLALLALALLLAAPAPAQSQAVSRFATLAVNLNTTAPQQVAPPADGSWVVTHVVVHSASRGLALRADGSPYTADIEVYLAESGDVLAVLSARAFPSPGRFFNLPVALPPSGNDAFGLVTQSNAPAVVVSEAIGDGATVKVDFIGYRVN